MNAIESTEVLTPLNSDGTVREFAAHGVRIRTAQGDVGTLIGYDGRGYLVAEFWNGFLANQGHAYPYSALLVLPASATLYPDALTSR